jgi:hypothetical protein
MALVKPYETGSTFWFCMNRLINERKDQTMSRTKRAVSFIFGVASVLGIIWLIRQRRSEIGGLRDWQQVLIKRHGVEKAQRLTAAIRQQHTALVAETPLPNNRALGWHLTGNILPGLALYRVLLQEYDGNQQAALAEVDDVLRTRMVAKSRLLFAPLKLLPDPFPLFKLIFPQVMKGFPPEGWDITYVENGGDNLAFNITRCFYLNTLTALGAPELTASFCKSDDVMAESFPPAIRFVRPHTLGRGQAMCDFQYCRVDEKAS